MISIKRRLWIVRSALCLTIFLFCCLAAQFFKTQVIEHERWAFRAKRQHYFVVKEAFRRGTFYGNTSVQPGYEGKRVPFAIDVPLYHLYADPKAIPVEVRGEIQEQVIRSFSPSLRETKRLGGELARRSRSRRLVSWIPEQQRALFLSWWRPFAKGHKIASNALYFVLDFRRLHPMGHLLGQVLHTIQERRDEVTGKASPTGGLELSMDGFLEGSVGFRRLMRSPYNSLETGEVLRQPVHGADVELTINPVLQAIAESELEKGVKQFKAKGGMAILAEPKTGQILAMAQYPFFIPDKYPDYFNDEALSERSKITAITDAREPGSPMKALTVALALKANREQEEKGLPALFSPIEKIPTSSGAFPGRSKPLKDVTCHRFLNLYMAMQKSSNIYMAILAHRMVKTMGEKWYREKLVKTFGLSTKTGVELVGESLGVLPVPGVFNSGWSKAAPYSLAIGYNLQTSALQMVRAYCVLANGGVLPDLTLVRKVISDERGTLVDNTEPEREKEFPRVLERDDVKKLLQALRFVTKKGGTSSKADVFGYTEIGKSGTAMKLVNGKYSENAHFASFIGFAPAEKPTFVLYVALEEPWVGHITGRGFNHRGGTCAAPIFREIARRTLEFLGVREDDPYGYPSHDPRSDLTKADWYEEVEKLNMLYKKWNNA